MKAPFDEYLLLFECHADYFECHEVLEEAWQAGGRSHLGYAALIQYAVSHYHARRGNVAGAEKSRRYLKQKLPLAAPSLEALGVDVARLASMIEDGAFETTIPLHRAERNRIDALKSEYPPTTLTFEQLVHKHVMRDRSDVLRERDEARANRRN